jgi:hypothetical protein
MQRSRSDQEKSRQMTDQHDNATGIFTFADMLSLGIQLEMKRGGADEHVPVVVKCPSNMNTEKLRRA